MDAKNSIDLDSDPCSIIGSRLLDAPRELVFSAFTDPKHLAQWWGPDGFTTTTHSFEFRTGGVWRFVMHGPDGRTRPRAAHMARTNPVSARTCSRNQDLQCR